MEVLFISLYFANAAHFFFILLMFFIIRLKTWYFHAVEPRGFASKGVVVFFHGNGENMSSHYLSLCWLLWNGYDFVIFDYRGYGRSAGSPSPKSTLEDGKEGLRWVHRHYPHLPIAIFGQSLGSAVSLQSVLALQAESQKQIQSEIPIQLIIIDSGFASYQDAAKSVLAKHWMTWMFQPFAYLFLSDADAPKEKVAKISPIPLIIIHGDQDQIIDFSLGKKLYSLAKPPKDFWKIPQGQHTHALWRNYPNTRQSLLQRLDQLFCKTPCQPRPLQNEPWIKKKETHADGAK